MILIAQTILLISPFPLHLYSHGDQETEDTEGPCCTTVQAAAWSKLILHIIEQTDSVCVYTDWQVNIFLLISPRELPLTGRFRSRILP